MPPVSHTLIDHVRAPIDRVFALLNDPARMPEWLPGCSAVEAEGPLKYGARFKVRFGTRLTECEIVDFAPRNGFGWVEGRQRGGSKTFFDSISSVDLLQSPSETSGPHSLSAWVQGRVLGKRNVPRHLRTILQNLQRLLSP